MSEFKDLNREVAEPKDISADFLSAGSGIEFYDFLRTQTHEPSLSITIDWQGEDEAKLLKAFLEDNVPKGQKRTATIRATKEQHDLAQNAFASGVKWEKI